MEGTLTRRQFYDLFLLCLYWQSDPDHPMSCWTTVDKVARILNELGLLDDKGRKTLFRDTALQGYFWQQAEIKPFEMALKDALEASKKEILIQVSSERAIDPDRFNKSRLVRDEHLFITARGAKIAKVQLESQYGEALTLETYFEQVQKDREAFNLLDEVAQKSIFKRYRERVKQETP